MRTFLYNFSKKSWKFHSLLALFLLSVSEVPIYILFSITFLYTDFSSYREVIENSSKIDPSCTLCHFSILLLIKNGLKISTNANEIFLSMASMRINPRLFPNNLIERSSSHRETPTFIYIILAIIPV